MAQYSSVYQLYDDVAKYVNTKESSLIETVPSWVYQAEVELDRRLRHPAAMVMSSFTMLQGTQRIPAPKEMTELCSIRCENTNETLYRRSYETVLQMYNPEKYPKYFASVSNYFYLDKTVTENVRYEFIFYTSPDKLSPEITDNFYLQVIPDFLLYITLEKAFIFNGEPQQAQYWRQMGEVQLAALEAQIKRENDQGSTLISMNDTARNQYYY